MFQWVYGVHSPPCSAFSTTPIHARPSSASHPLPPSLYWHWWTRHRQSCPSFCLPTHGAASSSGRMRLVLGKHHKVGVTRCYCGCGQIDLIILSTWGSQKVFYPQFEQRLLLYQVSLLGRYCSQDLSIPSPFVCLMSQGKTLRVFFYMSRFALLVGGVRVKVRVREQRKIIRWKALY